MKVLIPYDIFPGGFLTSIGKAFIELGHDVIECPRYQPSTVSRIFHRLDHNGILGVKSKIKAYRFHAFNSLLVNLAKSEKVDLFFGMSGGGYHPDTIEKIKKLGITTITYVADNPCDPRRDKYYAMSLKYYDIILYADEIWMKILNKLAVNSTKIKFLGGYDPKVFFPEKIEGLNDTLIEKLSHDIVFTGGSYKESAEGSYRAGILGQLVEDKYDVKIWGDRGWLYRTQFYPSLSNRINTNRLPYNELRYLFQLSKVYLNMPSPQIFTSFQPRVFEIAASKGFQIIDHSDELEDIFGDSYVSFKDYNDLKDKLDYFLKRDDERNEIAEKMYRLVINGFTWSNQLRMMLKQIGY
jgi:spore maturation protein CgeB